MNDKKFARENKRIIKGMGIGMLVGPLFFLISFFFKTSGHIQSFQVIVSIAIGVLIDWTTNGMSISITQIILSGSTWEWFLDGAILELLFIR